MGCAGVTEVPTMPRMRLAPVAECGRCAGSRSRDQAGGDRKPKDRRPEDQGSGARNHEAAEQCQQPRQPRSVGHGKRRGRKPDEAQDRDQSALNEEIEQYVVSLEVRREAWFGAYDKFGFVRPVMSPSQNSWRYFKMWPWA